MLSRNRLIATSVLTLLFNLSGLSQNTEMVQVAPPPIRRAEPPSANASAQELEGLGDQFRSDKNFLDAIDYYEAAARKAPSAALFNKIGICDLLLQRYREARRDFGKAIKTDANHADAYNNLGVVYYEQRDYGRAIKNYLKAVGIHGDAASYYSNLGAAYFSRKQFDKAAASYSKALELDPDVFERISRAGVQAQLPSPEDRARYDYVLAKLYAKMGVPDRSIRYLRKAMEEGFKDIKNVYKDSEFSEVRKDPRFAELMAEKPIPIQE